MYRLKWLKHKSYVSEDIFRLNSVTELRCISFISNLHSAYSAIFCARHWGLMEEIVLEALSPVGNLGWQTLLECVSCYNGDMCTRPLEPKRVCCLGIVGGRF